MSDANIGIAVLNDSGKYLKRLGAPYRVWYFDDWTTAFYPEAVIRKVFNNGFDDAFDAEREALRSEIVSKLKQAHGVSMLDLGQDGVIHPKCVMLDNSGCHSAGFLIIMIVNLQPKRLVNIGLGR